MSYEIGQRVRDEHGFAGTVRYVGPVATSKDASASWVGVEWDDATRGKHDGMVTCKDGTSVRHFTCPFPCSRPGRSPCDRSSSARSGTGASSSAPACTLSTCSWLHHCNRVENRRSFATQRTCSTGNTSDRFARCLILALRKRRLPTSRSSIGEREESLLVLKYMLVVRGEPV